MKKAKKKKLELTEPEIKLLISILKEAEDNRSDMGCNDAYGNEKKLFPKVERLRIQNTDLAAYYKSEYSKEDLEELDGDMSNYDYVKYMLVRIKSQL